MSFIGKCRGGPLNGEFLEANSPVQYMTEKVPMTAFKPIAVIEPLKLGHYEHVKPVLDPTITFGYKKDEIREITLRNSFWLWSPP